MAAAHSYRINNNSSQTNNNSHNNNSNTYNSSNNTSSNANDNNNNNFGISCTITREFVLDPKSKAVSSETELNVNSSVSL